MNKKRNIGDKKVLNIFCAGFLCGGVFVAGEGLQRLLLQEASRSFSGSKSDPPLAKIKPIKVE